MTGLIQDVLNASHLRNRKTFVGAKNVKDRDVASWTLLVSGGSGSEEFSNPVC